MAQLAGMKRQGVAYHIAKGHISRGADGRLNRADAQMLRQQRRVLTDQPTDARGSNLLKVRVRAGAVKIKRLRLEYTKLQQRTVERSLIAAKLQDSGRTVLAQLASWPDRYAEQLAGDLGLAVEAARAVLQQFSELAVVELGDVAAEADALLRRI